MTTGSVAPSLSVFSTSSKPPRARHDREPEIPSVLPHGLLADWLFRCGGTHADHRGLSDLRRRVSSATSEKTQFRNVAIFGTFATALGQTIQ